MEDNIRNTDERYKCRNKESHENLQANDALDHYNESEK